MSEDARREAFLEATLDEMQTADLVDHSTRDDVRCWLRTVWLEARREPWGANAVEPEQSCSEDVHVHKPGGGCWCGELKA